MTKEYLNRQATLAYNEGASGVAVGLISCREWRALPRIVRAQVTAAPRGGQLCGPEHHVGVRIGDLKC